MLDVERFDVALFVGFFFVQFDKPRISTGCESPGMDKSKFGAKLRIARTRLGLRQVDVATIAGVSRTTVSKAERGLLHAFSIDLVERLSDAVECWFEGDLRSRRCEIDRLMNAGHAALGESVARWIGMQPGWEVAAEVSFGFGREFGIVDVLAIHSGTGRLVLIELKTSLFDINEHLGTLDRKRRLAARIAQQRGWVAKEVCVWLVLANSRTNRRAVARHRALIASQLPADGRSFRPIFTATAAARDGLAFWTNVPQANVRRGSGGNERVRKRNAPAGSSRGDEVDQASECDPIVRRVLRGSEGGGIDAGAKTFRPNVRGE